MHNSPVLDSLKSKMSENRLQIVAVQRGFYYYSISGKRKSVSKTVKWEYSLKELKTCRDFSHE
jgi:hypothetical protein